MPRPIITLNNLMQWNDGIFDNARIPAGVDAQALVNTILINYGDMQIIYPDWSALRYYSDNWFNAHFHNLERLWSAYMADYNAIWNKDGTVSEKRTPNLTTENSGTDTENSSNTRTLDWDDKTTYNSTFTDTHTGDQTEQIKGFNSSAFNDTTKSNPNLTDTTTRTGDDTLSHDGTDSATGSRSVTHGKKEWSYGSETIERREYGNIGVTSSQSLIVEEKKLYENFNFYTVAAEMWASDFCVMIY